MLTDGLVLVEGSEIENLVVDTGSAFPGSASEGELFFRTDLFALYAYANSVWEAIGTAGSLSTHESDTTVHLDKTGDTMDSNADLTFSGGGEILGLPVTPSASTAAASKAYVDSLTASSVYWKDPVIDSDLVDVVSSNDAAAYTTYSLTTGDNVSFICTASFTANLGGVTVAAVAGNIINLTMVNATIGNYTLVETPLTAGDRFIIAAEHGTIGSGLSSLVVSGFALANGDLIQHVSGDGSLAAHWSVPDGRSGNAGGGTEIVQGLTVLNSDPDSVHYGHTFLYDQIANAWVEIAGPGSVEAGTYLSYSGNALNVDFSSNVGMGESSPLAKLHIKTTDAGAFTAPASGDELILENSSSGGMTILTGNAHNGNIYFGDADSANSNRFSFNHSAEKFEFVVTDINRMSLTTTELASIVDVTISKTSPYAKLNRSATTGYSTLRFETATVMDWEVYTQNAASPDLVFYADGAARVVMEQSGNVGINTANPSENVAGGTLDLSGTVLHIKNAAAGARVLLEGNAPAFDMMDLGGAADDKWIKFDCNGGLSRFRTFTDAGGIRADNILVMDMGTGNVGIGTITPAYNLVVSNANAEGLEIDPGNSANTTLVQFYNRTGLTYDTAKFVAADYNFQIGGTTKAVIDTSGNMGIGETVPLGKVHIKSNDAGAITGGINALADELVIENSGSAGITIVGGTASNCSIYFGDSGNSDIGGIAYVNNDNTMRFHTNTAERGYISAALIWGAPTGSHDSPGVVWAQEIWDDNTQLVTDYVFDLHQDGIVKEEDLPQAEGLLNDPEMLDLGYFSNFWKTNRHLPTMPSRASFKETGGQSLGALAQKLWETTEIQAIHIDSLNNKNKTLASLLVAKGVITQEEADLL